MKTATRPQYHRLQRILELIREGTRTGSLPNCGHFIGELEVSRRTLMRDRRCSLRANSGIECGNECGRAWLVACHRAN